MRRLLSCWPLLWLEYGVTLTDALALISGYKRQAASFVFGSVRAAADCRLLALLFMNMMVLEVMMACMYGGKQRTSRFNGHIENVSGTILALNSTLTRARISPLIYFPW